MFKTLISYFFIFIYICDCTNSNVPKVKTDQGDVTGEYLYTYKGRKLSSFIGIPYAEPPIGNLRFRDPIPAKSWSGELKAENREIRCSNINYFTDKRVSGQEDCLYLNVYTPQLSQSEKLSLPVMVFIHGGGFTTGHGNKRLYGPHLLLDQDVVLVVMNYRLGLLGFLSTQDIEVPGNGGLKDQALAIKWVKDNIAHFGGDTNKITLFGQSAGGASVHLQTVSPLSKNLINGAIFQSGSFANMWAIKPKEISIANAMKVGKHFNCTTSSTREMVECLRAVDVYEILKFEKTFSKWDIFPLFPFMPVIEPEYENAFLTQHPIDILKAGKASDVPFMTGFTGNDAAIFTPVYKNDLKKVMQIYSNFEEIVPIIFNFENAVRKNDYSKKLKKLYLRTENITLESITNDLDKLYNDGMIFSGITLAADLHSKYSSKPVYLYNFDFQGTYGHVDCSAKARLDLGVLHEDDITYLLSCDKLSNILDTEANIVELMTTLWTNFASTGNPTPEINSIVKAKWEPAQSGSLRYYKISGDSLGMEDNIYIERQQIWEDIKYDRRVYHAKEEL